MAFKLKQDSEKALNNKGIALLNLNRADEAIKEFEKGIKLSAENTGLLNNKGIALIELKRPEDAL